MSPTKATGQTRVGVEWGVQGTPTPSWEQALLGARSRWCGRRWRSPLHAHARVRLPWASRMGVHAASTRDHICNLGKQLNSSEPSLSCLQIGR